MRAVILAGGLGTRISEETVVKPKPMIEVGGKPILWHLMKIYSHYGINDFIVCLGYRGYVIKEYFANYFLHTSDVTFEVSKNKMHVHQAFAEPWTVTLVDTGANTQTGGRLKRLREHLGTEDFCFTYGDGLAKINIKQLISFHKEHGKLATVTATKPPGRFGALQIKNNSVETFKEKPQGDGSWINGGFFVLNPKVIDYIEGDSTVWEVDPMLRLVNEKQLQAYLLEDFWQPMDTLRDRIYLEELWTAGKAPWKVWS